jgi:RHS repeat-associated protein
MASEKLNIQEIQLKCGIEVNTAGGNAVATIDIPLPEGRSGMSPQVGLVYSSTGRNSAFGVGWSMAGISMISVDTLHGFPQYDGNDSFALNGSQSLAPELINTSQGWVPRTDQNADYWVYYYRPLYEQTFDRFEKWVKKDSGDIYWRSRSKNNIVSIFGFRKDGTSRIMDPEKPSNVYGWFLEAKYDDNGNAILYNYKQDDEQEINSVQPYETERLKKFLRFGFGQKYPVNILYGNTIPASPDTVFAPENKWIFEIVFDYGQFAARPYMDSSPALNSHWTQRADPFSVYSSGFELRTYRLCRRLMIYRHFDELRTPDSLTGIFEMIYDEKASGTLLKSVLFTGVRRDLVTGAYSEKSLPPLLFNYTKPNPDDSFQSIVQQSNENLPNGLNDGATRLIDLFGEGMPGILTEAGNTWYYKPNLGRGIFGDQYTIPSRPSLPGSIFALGDFDQNGNINVFSLQGRTAGFYEFNNEEQAWSGFQALQSIAQVSRYRFMDVTGDGLPDILVEHEDKVTCYPFKGKEGFGEPYQFSKAVGEDSTPVIGDHYALNFFMADMSGDGRPDQVRIQNGCVEYYPNLGNGRFGQRVIMANAPVIDFENTFNPARVRLYDLDGSGTTDIIYLGTDEIRYWYNESGNRFSEGKRIPNLPVIDNVSTAMIADFLGNGTPCLVWSTSLNHLGYSSIQYLELTSGQRPRLLLSMENSMGQETLLEYGYSATHFIDAKRQGNAWATKMPFHFPVVNKKTITDHITEASSVSIYKYHDGSYNGKERRFISFGAVEQYDSDILGNTSFETNSFTTPSCTKNWFHNGLFGSELIRSKQFYKGDVSAPYFGQQFFEQTDPLDEDDFEKGYRSLAGKSVRQEVYGTDKEGKLLPHPYVVIQTNYAIRKIQPKTTLHDSCFFCFATEIIHCDYEQQPTDPRISHQLVLAVGQYGDVEKTANIYYARRAGQAGAIDDQLRDRITANRSQFSHVSTLDKYAPGIHLEEKAYEFNHFNHAVNGIVALHELQAAFDGIIAATLSADQRLPAGGASVAKLISWKQAFFWNNDRTAVLPFGQTGELDLIHHEETACFNDAMINAATGGRVTQLMLVDENEGNYLQRDGYYWQRNPVNHYYDAIGFYLVSKFERKTGIEVQYRHDPYFLYSIESISPFGLSTKIEIDYNVGEAYRVTDTNNNISELLYDPLGISIAIFNQGTILDDTNTLQKYGSGLAADYTLQNDDNLVNALADPAKYLQTAEIFVSYSLDSWRLQQQPLSAITLTRENLVHDGKGNLVNNNNCLIAIEYQDGFGRTIQVKQSVEPGPAIKKLADGSIERDAEGNPVTTITDLRFNTSGHVVYNNKQLPVRQYEPFFSGTAAFESSQDLDNFGVSILNYYDAMQRVIRIDYPDGTFEETFYAAWEACLSDKNDTVDRSLYKTFREFLHANEPEKMALGKSLLHKDTPTIVKMDPMNNQIVNTGQNNNGKNRSSQKKFDIGGNLENITDSRGIIAFEYNSDMAGRLMYEKSIDAGEKYLLCDASNQLIHSWDSRGIHKRTEYDRSDRIKLVRIDGVGLNQVVERYTYGEDIPLEEARNKNLLGQIVKHYDQAGTAEVKLYTPAGSPMVTERNLLTQFKTEVNWNNPDTVALGERFVSSYTYDAGGRMTEQQLPDNTIRKNFYSKGGLLQKIAVSTRNGRLNNTEILRDTLADAKGMKEKIVLGNGVELKYTYDPQTFRLKRVYSKLQGALQRVYQDINYTYDPIGNLIYYIDQAQETAAAAPLVINGLTVNSVNEFEYDALYQLITATGRVHQALVQNDYGDRSREAGLVNWRKGTRHITLNNGAAVERYSRRYEYDASGNLQKITHAAASQNWVLEKWISPRSNRSTLLNDLNGNPLANAENNFDANGNCIAMPHLRGIEWNYRNNISKAVVIDRSDTGLLNDEEYYVYAGDGMRIRKITQRLIDNDINRVEITEKIYFDGCEITRVLQGDNEILKRFTSHISDGDHVLARLYTWEKDNLQRETDNVAHHKFHYQLTNHLGSATMELDEQGDIITYEEFFPHGGSSFIAGRGKREIDLKDYRYSGKERDDFTGLYYFGYRYYAHWIGGWMSPDPLGPEGGDNLYLYVDNNPVNLVDPNGLEVIGQVKAGLTEKQAIAQFNASDASYERAVKVFELKKEGDSWVIVSGRERSPEEVERYWKIREKFKSHPDKAAELIGLGDFLADQKAEMDAAMEKYKKMGTEGDGETGDGDSTGMGGKGQGTGGGNGDSSGGEGQKPDQVGGGADSSSGDSTGTDDNGDTGNGGVNDGTTGGTKVKTNAGGGGGNGADAGNGNGKKGSGTGGGATTPGTGGTGITGTGSGTGAGTGTGKGATGDKSGKPNGKEGSENQSTEGKPNGVKGGTGTKDAGVPNLAPGGDPNGQVGGSLAGRSTGNIDGTLDKDEEGVHGKPQEGEKDGKPDGVEGGVSDGQGQGNGQGPRNANGGGGKPGSKSSGGSGSGEPDEDPPWWKRALLAVGGALYTVANIFIEAVKQVYDMVGLAVACFGKWTGWYDYDHEVASGIGMAAEAGMGTGDILYNMGKNIIETPKRLLDAAERGDYWAFGSEAMNIYMLGKSAYGIARSIPRLAGGIRNFGRAGFRSTVDFFKRGANNLFNGKGGFARFGSAHRGMGATTGKGFFSMSRGFAVRSAPLRYGLWRAGIAGRNMVNTAAKFAQKFNPLRFTSAQYKGMIGEGLARVKSYMRGETHLGSQVELTVDGVRTIGDHAVMDQWGFIKIIEAKLGPYSHFTPAQAAAWRGGSVALIVERFFGSKAGPPGL